MPINTAEKFLIKNLFIYLYVAFSFGLIKCAAFLSEAVYRCIAIKIDVSSSLRSLYDWIAISDVERDIWDYKLTSIIFYTLTIILLGVFYAFGCVVIHRKKILIAGILHERNRWFGLSCLSFVSIFNLVFLFTHWHSHFMFLCWVFAFFSLLFISFWSQLSKIKIKSWLSGVSVLVIVVQFFLIFYGYIFKQVFVANDYMDIPEKTILSKNNIVDNTSYINVHGIGGLDKYDPRIDMGKTPFPKHKSYIALPAKALLSSFIETGKRRYKYAYDNDRHILSLSGAMSMTELQELNALYAGDPNSLKLISDLYFLSRDSVKSLQKKLSTLEEKQFIKKNEMELIAQTRAGWILFHHSWILNPINAISLGAGPHTQQFLYGWLNTLFIKQLMGFLGDISYHTYFKALYLFYPIYYILFLAVTFLIFRNIKYVAIGAVLLSTSFLELGDLLIRLAPGHNPNRHFFDVIAFLLVYLFVKSHRLVYFFCSLGVCAFSILWSKDFGICLQLSIIATLILYHYSHSKVSYTKISFLFLNGLMGIWLYLSPIQGNSHNFIYSLLGLGVPGTPFFLILTLLMVINLCYLGYISLIQVNKPMFFLSLGLFFYCQLELIYYVWNSSIGHLLSIAPTIILLALTWLYLFRNFAEKKRYNEKFYLDIIFLSTLIFIYVPSSIKFYLDRSSYNKIFESHVVHYFGMQGAKFQSTMEPQLFEQTCDLINKYEKHPYMYLISKYDAILPVITKKYNAIPSVSVSLDLVSNVDAKRFINAITQNNPLYVFIDTDINRNFNGDIYDITDNVLGAHAASRDRAQMLINLSRLYRHLTKTYEPIEKGSLVTVYRKKQNI